MYAWKNLYGRNFWPSINQQWKFHINLLLCKILWKIITLIKRRAKKEIEEKFSEEIREIMKILINRRKKLKSIFMYFGMEKKTHMRKWSVITLHTHIHSLQQLFSNHHNFLLNLWALFRAHATKILKVRKNIVTKSLLWLMNLFFLRDIAKIKRRFFRTKKKSWQHVF